MSLIYAKVIVRHRNRLDELTYALDEKIIPYVKIGSLVEAPLARKTVIGIVCSLRQKVPVALKSKIRPLVTIRGEASPSTIELIRMLSKKSGAALSQTAYWILSGAVLNKINNCASDADLRDSLFIQASLTKRFQWYRDYLKSGRFCLIIFDSLRKARLFGQGTEESVILYHREKFYDVNGRLLHQIDWQKIQAVLSVGSGIFLPCRSPLTIILDQINSSGHSLKARPFFNSQMVALCRKKIEGHRLIFADNVAFPSQLRLIRQNQLKLLSFQDEDQFEIWKITNKEPIPQYFLNRIAAQLTNGQSVAIFSLNLAFALSVCCQKCLKCLTCQDCGRNLSVSQGKLLCRFCQKFLPLISQCPDCAGGLELIGCGLEQLESVLKNHFPDRVIAQNNSNNSSAAAGKIFLLKHSDAPIKKNYSICYFYNGDVLLISSQLDSHFLLAQKLRQLSSLAEKVVIMTEYYESEIWPLLIGRLEKFYIKEMKERFKLKLPPYLPEFVCRASLSNKLSPQNEYQVVCSRISEQYPNWQIGTWEATLQNKRTCQIEFSIYPNKTVSPLRLQELCRLIAPSWAIEVKN